jgi:hypothetical protein
LLITLQLRLDQSEYAFMASLHRVCIHMNHG